MSYRSFKRVLGETSLERKCRFLFGACLLFLITGSFWWYGSRNEDLVYANTRDTARHLVDAVMLQRHWMKSDFVNIPEKMKRGPLGTQSDFIKMEAETIQTHREYTASVFKPNPGDRDDRPSNDFEAKVLVEFSRQRPSDATQQDGQPECKERRLAESYLSLDQIGDKKLSVIKVISAATGLGLKEAEVLVERLPRKLKDGISKQDAENLKNELEVVGATASIGERQAYQYFQPARLRAGSCIECHESFSGDLVLGGAGLPKPSPLQVGDLVAVVEIVLPDEETQTALNKNRAILIATAIVTVFLAMIALYVIVRYVIVKPLKHLRDVSDEVSRGNVEARADIHTADEFEELGAAFNKMLRHLVTVQEELKGVNSSLDLKVDELAQLNMRLYELNRLKSDFLATMSHELRTPLNSIIGFSDVLGSINALDDKQKRYVQNIQKSGRVLLDMINDILDLAKIESGKMELRLTDFRIEDAISAQCDMARPLTEKKNIDLEIEVEPGLPELFQDQGKVQQILNNLLSNAIKFTPEGGRIVVTARQEARGDRDELVLTIGDTGVGIAEEDQIAIFEKFRQGKTALAGGDAMTREYSGTGLGLSIVKELCKLLGGEVALKSELGKGSTFTVRLPWVRADQPRMDSPLAENIDELIRPRRAELQRTLERPVPAAPK